MGQKPEDAVVDSVIAGFAAATCGPPAPIPTRGPELALLRSPAERCEFPGVCKAEPGPDAAPSPTVLTRDSALSSFLGLVSRGPQAHIDPRRSAQPDSGVAPWRGSKSLPSAVPAPDRPLPGPLLPDADCRLLEAEQTPEVRSRPWPPGLQEPELWPRPRGRHRFGSPFCTDLSQTFSRRRDLICL